VKPDNTKKEEEHHGMEGLLGGIFSKKPEEEIVFKNENQKPDIEEVKPISSEPNITFNNEDDGLNLEGDAPKYADWRFPSIDLLQDPVVQPQNKEIFKKNALIIEQTLKSF